MALRRKEKTLTLEEIKEKMIQSTKEFWLHGEPLCAFTPLIEGGKLISLSAKTENEIFAIFLLDPAAYATDRVMESISKWLEIYRKLPWLPIVVFKSDYLFLKNPRFYERFRFMSSFATLPVFIDERRDWFNHYEAAGPTLVFSAEGKTLLKISLTENFSEQILEAEIKLQTILREKDPGLPLLDAEQRVLKEPIDHALEDASVMTQTGYWTATESGIASDDPNAKISFPFSGTHLRLVAITHPQARENTKVQIFLDESPVPASIHGAQVHPGDRSQTVLEINKHSGVYELISSDRKITGTITLKFLNTLENPVILYGLRVA